MGELAVLQTTACRICFNNENNISLAKLNWEKLLRNCTTYLDTTIIIKTLENDTNTVPCCNYCYESSLQLTILEEQVKKLQKDLFNFSTLFSKTVLERRSLVEIEKDIYTKILTPQIEKRFSIPNNPDRYSTVVLENALVKSEASESQTNELPSNSQEKTDLIIDSRFATDGKENYIKGGCENFSHSNDEIDIKYSYDEIFSKVIDVVNKEMVPNQQMPTTNTHNLQKGKTTSLSDLLKSVKMPIIRLERLVTGRSKISPKIAACAGEKNVTYENALFESSESNNCSKTLFKEQPFNCREISLSKTFLNKKELVKPQKVHSVEKPEKPYKCTKCLKSFARSDGLKVHERIHSGETPYKCNNCGKSFTRSDGLKTHEKIHSGEKSYKCNICEKSFARSDRLKYHERLHYTERPFKCVICEKSFARAYSLEIHERFHSGERPYKCKSCEKCFKSNSDLVKHEKIHSEGNPYKCSKCSESFARSDRLRVHEITHSGPRRFNCSICSKSFAKLFNLQTHEKMHSGEKPYQCNICEKSFARSDRLKCHKKYHTGDRPYKCSLCSKSYKRSTHLRCHERIHSGVTPYKCNVLWKIIYKVEWLKKSRKNSLWRETLPM